MVTSVLLILAVFLHINGITCDGEITVMPQQKQFCDFDAFISSKPVNGKVFLIPFESAKRTGDWFQNSGYCAAHCAEMVTINSAEENTILVEFAKITGMGEMGVWLGAVIDNQKDFTHWYNEDPVTYTHTREDYNEPGLTPLLTGFRNLNIWGNWEFDTPGVFIACQRPSEWTICE